MCWSNSLMYDNYFFLQRLSDHCFINDSIEIGCCHFDVFICSNIKTNSIILQICQVQDISFFLAKLITKNLCH